MTTSRATQFKPNLVILSHWHIDHYNLLESLNNEKDFIVIEPYFDVRLPKKNKPTFQGIEIIKRLMEKRQIYFVKDTKDGLVYNKGRMFLYKASSLNATTNYLNRNALILTIDDVLLPGDCTYTVFPTLLRNRIGEFSKFICTHHGRDIDSNLSLLDIHSNKVRWGIICTDISYKQPDLAQRKEYHQMNIGLIYLLALKYYKEDEKYRKKKFRYSKNDSIENILLFDFTKEIGQNISDGQDFTKMTIEEVDNITKNDFNISTGMYFDKISITIKNK